LFYAKRGLLALVIVIVALPILGFVYQRVGEANDKQTYPPPGQRVDVGGYSLHIHCMGEGSPTVILEAGTGGSSLDWSLVHPSIAETIRVCAYDRQGYGWSDDSAHPRTSQEVATDLHTLLTNAQIDAPFVMVGHSIGAIHVQAYVDQYPDEVAGVVMVDRATAEYFVSLGQSDEEIAAVEGNTDIAYLVTMIGIPRLLNFIPSPVSNDLPPDIRPTYDATVFQTRYYASLGEELRNLGSNYRFAASLPPFSGDLPMVVLVHDPAVGGNPTEPLHYESRLAYAARYPNARVVTAEGSNHFIHVQRPDLVIESIQDVVEAVRTGEPLAQ
jgi:pimeloyl-ACP methyl ester carboxylesterase